MCMCVYGAGCDSWLGCGPGEGQEEESSDLLQSDGAALGPQTAQPSALACSTGEGVNCRRPEMLGDKSVSQVLGHWLEDWLGL